MRIAICTDVYLPQLSGIADSLEILMRELLVRGHEVRLYAPHREGAIADEHIVRLRSYAVPGSGGGLMLVLPFGALKNMRKFAPNVVYTNTAGSAGYFALYASWRLRLPLLGTDHTFPAEYLHYAKLNYVPFRYLVRKFSSWYYAHCDAITAPSQSMLDELRAYGSRKLKQRPMRVISNHLPTDVFRPLQEKQSLKKKHGIQNTAVLLFGRIALEKNLEFALDVYADVAKKSDAELVIVGDGPYRETLRASVHMRGLETRVRFLGVLRREELAEALNACDVLLITSMSETQSMTTLQGMACGLPVVAVNAGGLPEYVHDGKNGYVIDAQDTELFSERIQELLHDEMLRHRMGNQGRIDAGRFSPLRITEEFLVLFTMLAEGRKGAENKSHSV